MTPRRRRPALLLLSILLLVAAGAVLAEVAPPLALCASSEDGSNETSTSSTTCGGAAVVHPPPSAAASSGYVDCVSPGASVDARCVAGALSASVSARSVDGEGVEKLETDPAAAFTFPPADTGAVLAACPDSPLLPDALGTDGNTDLTGLPTQEALEAAAEQVKGRGERGAEREGSAWSLFRNSHHQARRAARRTFSHTSPIRFIVIPKNRSPPASPPCGPTPTPWPASTPATTPPGGRPPWPRPRPPCKPLPR